VLPILDPTFGIRANKKDGNWFSFISIQRRALYTMTTIVRRFQLQLLKV